MQGRDSQVGLGRLLWVGPPVYSTAYEQGITNTYDTVGPQVLGSRYVSSRNWTYPDWGRAADRVHFTLDGARQWALGIVSWLRRQTTGGGIRVLLAVAVAALTVHWYLRRR